jgi:hypothetical protein
MSDIYYAPAHHIRVRSKGEGEEKEEKGRGGQSRSERGGRMSREDGSMSCECGDLCRRAQVVNTVCVRVCVCLCVFVCVCVCMSV